jgi:2-methylcitrate dehydratase PrpD
MKLLAPEAIAAARRLVLDGIVIALTGTGEEAIGILTEPYRGMGARPDSVALGLGFRTASTLAAALNGANSIRAAMVPAAYGDRHRSATRIIW